MNRKKHGQCRQAEPASGGVLVLWCQSCVTALQVLPFSEPAAPPSCKAGKPGLSGRLVEVSSQNDFGAQCLKSLHLCTGRTDSLRPLKTVPLVTQPLGNVSSKKKLPLGLDDQLPAELPARSLRTASMSSLMTPTEHRPMAPTGSVPPVMVTKILLLLCVETPEART